MDDPPILDPVAQVVAWHNRNPLALRIKPDHVSGIGVVSLPFVVADEPPAKPWQRLPKMVWQKLLRLAKRPETQPAGAPLKAAFSEDFIAPISAKQVAAFALLHGSPERPGAADLPQREVAVDEKLASGPVVRLYLTTACVEKRKGRVRVLLGSAAKSKFLGGRLWDKPKRAAAAGVAVLLVAAPLIIGSMWGRGPTADASTTAAVAPAASGALVTAAAPAALAASEPSTPDSSEVASATASAPSQATGVAEAVEPAASAEQAHSAAAPAASAADHSTKSAGAAEADAAPEPQTIEPGVKQAVRPGLSAEERAEAVRQANLLRSQTPAPVVKPTKIYALVSSLTGTRAASERRLHMIGLSFAGGKMSGDLRSEIMKVDKGWRATLWPFTSRTEAEAARDMLADRGVYTEVLAF
jgi:hypothetical protein